MKFGALTLGSGLIMMIFSTLGAENALTEANAVERLTISGLLAIGVIVLYRELNRERKKSTAREDELKTFIAAQTLATQRSAQITADAIAKMANALQAQQVALGQQTELYHKHISRIVESATR